MGKVLSFRPQSIHASQNFADYVGSAKALPFIRAARFEWGGPVWDLAGLAKPERAGQSPTVNFKGLQGAFGEFARALVAHRIAEAFGNPKQVGRYSKPIARMRDLASSSKALGITHPCDLTLEAFHDTATALGAASKSPYSLGQQTSALKWVYDALEHAAVLNVPFEWEPPGSLRKSARNRIKPEKQGRPLASREIEAIAYAFRNAKTPRDLLMTSILALLCCAPMRIDEVLSLPADCEVLPDPGDGFRGGLRWWPKKGGRPQVKYVPEAMLPVAREALQRIRVLTDPARKAAQRRLDGDQRIKVPKDFPEFCATPRLAYNHALFVVEKGLAHSERDRRPDGVERLTYHQVRRAMLGDSGAISIFHSTGALAPDEPAFELTTHMARHYLNTLAQQANVPQADIALWSGRKLVTQNNAYDHETAEELVARIKAKRGPERLPSIKIEDRAAWEMSLVKDTAHTTQFGWCQQSLRQDPCQMFGQCLNCQHLVCIKGAEGKLANIKSELDKEKALRDAAFEKKARGYPVKERWLDLFERKIARLEELIGILESEDVADGTAVRNADAGPERLPQFDLIAFGKARNGLSVHDNGQGEG